MMLWTLTFRPAGRDDELALRALLTLARLPHDDLDSERQLFLVAVDGESGALVGTIGLEPAGRDGLVRSFAVDPAWQGHGVGQQLYDRLLAVARLRGVATLYLLTQTAEAWFSRRGFARCDRAAVPAAIAATAEFKGLCPAAAVCLSLPLTPDS